MRFVHDGIAKRKIQLCDVELVVGISNVLLYINDKKVINSFFMKISTCRSIIF